MAVIYLIRHGQASFLKSDYDKLSELGITQSKTLGESLKRRNATATQLEGGSMLRHQETAAHCLKALDKKGGYSENSHWNEYDHTELMVRHNPEFAEFGKLATHIKSQENPHRALQELLNRSISDWLADKHEYTVSWTTFKSQVWQALEALAAKLGKGENAWVFTSGGPISAVMVQLLGLKDEQFMELQARIVNTSMTKVLVGRNGFSLSTYNDYSHLEHEPDWITYR